jgi:hypothetical protein
VAATVAVAGLPVAAASPGERQILVAFGACATLLQGVAVFRGAFVWAATSAGVLLVEYAIVVVVAPAARGPVAVAFGCGLLLAAELAAWSVDLARAGREPVRLAWRRAGTLATLTLGSAVMAAVVVLPAELLGTRHGVVVRGAGVAAAVAAVAILAWLSIRAAIRPAHPGWAKARRR